MKRIKVDGKKFIDEEGSQVIFNGICFICRDKTKGYLEPSMKEKLKIYAKKGFNLIRLGIFWDGVEPLPGFYDEEYLNRIAEVVEEAKQCGIYVFLDMHQDLYSAKFIDGAPAWATLDEGLPAPERNGMWYDSYLSCQALIKAADNFWANKEAPDGIGLLDHYEAMWEHIADRYKNYTNLIGLEPMNEPYMGSIAPQTFGISIAKIKEKNPDFDLSDVQNVTVEERDIMQNIMTEQFMKFDKEVLMPFYNRILRAIRKVSDVPLVTGGNIYCSSFVTTGIEHVTDRNGTVDEQQIYAPHGYDSVVDTDNYGAYNKENVAYVFAGKRTSQEELQLPVIVGEWGNFPSGDYTNDLIEHMSGILEEYLWSSTYHQYCEGMEQDKNYNSLERGYPVSITGDLISYHYNYDTKSLSVKWMAIKDGSTQLYLPDLSGIDSKRIFISKKANIVINQFNHASGGYIKIIADEDGLMEVNVG